MSSWIPLIGGKVALVDDADFERVSQFEWTAWFNRSNRTWYAQRIIGTKKGRRHTVWLHRFVLGRSCAPEPFDGIEVDHIDFDGLNCQRENLRTATHAQNAQHQRRRSDNTSGFKGVHYEKRTGKFIAYVNANGHRTYLRRFNTALEAAHARDALALSLHQEFTELSVPNA